MTKKELISILKSVPEDAEIRIGNPLGTVSDVNIATFYGNPICDEVILTSIEDREMVLDTFFSDVPETEISLIYEKN